MRSRRRSSGPRRKESPFETGHRAAGNAGFDLKIGLKSNLTLDATVNPDFGQVEVDPAVLNLSAYETYYEEKRPFFIEGASLFNNFGRGGVFMNANINWPMPSFFYSRRIGREPQGYVTEDGFARMPDRTTILGAAKVTGKLGGSWNVGWLNAVTGREFAQIDRIGTRLTQEVEPFTYYGALRVQKDIAEGRSGFGLMATGVARDLDTETLGGILNKSAFSLAADGWVSLDKKKNWVVGGWAGATRVEGTVDQILRLQTSSMHYFQRPDATHVAVDPTATSLSGWAGRVNLAKQNGNLLVLASAGAISQGFNPNDVGFQYGAWTWSTCSSCRAISGRSRARSSATRSSSAGVSGITISRGTRSGTAGCSSSRGSSGTSGCSTPCSPTTRTRSART